MSSEGDSFNGKDKDTDVDITYVFIPLRRQQTLGKTVNRVAFLCSRTSDVQFRKVEQDASA